MQIVDTKRVMDKDGAILAREFRIEAAGRSVPGIVWTPEEMAGRRPMVLVGHGGSGHKASNLVLNMMRPLVHRHQFVVAAIDGPVHGARRAVFDDGVAVRSEFRALWAEGQSIDPMVVDWRATIDALCRLPEVDEQRLGWFGISMGTAYGLPLVAADSRIKAAVLGMWGTCRPASERLVSDGPKVRCPVLFQQKSDDEFFTDRGQRDIYDHLGTDEKQLRLYPGRHTDPESDQIADAEAFLASHLA